MRLIDTLRELVRLKDLKTEAEAIETTTPAGANYKRQRAMLTEYAAKKDRAWAAARKMLQQHDMPPCGHVNWIEEGICPICQEWRERWRSSLATGDEDILYQLEHWEANTEELYSLIAYAAEEIRRSRRQLPADMKDCTIVAIECPKGHTRLTATNWVDTGCKACRIDELTELLKRPAPIPSSGQLEVGLTVDEAEVILNHPQIDQDEDGGHILFSPAQAMNLGALLIKKAKECRPATPNAVAAFNKALAKFQEDGGEPPNAPQ